MKYFSCISLMPNRYEKLNNKNNIETENLLLRIIYLAEILIEMGMI